jgi:hypothetical protein
MGDNWARGVLYGLAIVACFVAYGLTQGYRRRTRLAILKSERDDSNCKALCRAKFPDLPAERVEAAYRWVQSLGAPDGVPLLPDDDVLAVLGIDQGDVDAKLEASYECYGEEKDRGLASRTPIRTVADLMALVLAAGYENYPSPLREPSAAGAA